MNDPKLWFCPFCGSEVQWYERGTDPLTEGYLYGVLCKNQSCQAVITFEITGYTREKFAERFNRRNEATE